MTPDLLQLADIARDRTAQGRARLFALLAALLCERWSSLTARERDMLAELLIVLVPRADPADLERLGRHLATRPAIPGILQPLVILPPAPMSTAGVSNPGVSNTGVPNTGMPTAGKKGPTITITAPIRATARTRPIRALRRRPRLTVNPLEITLRPDRQPDAAVQVDVQAEPAAQSEIMATPPVMPPSTPQPVMPPVVPSATQTPIEAPAAQAERAAPPAMPIPPIETASVGASPVAPSPVTPSPVARSPLTPPPVVSPPPMPASTVAPPARSQMAVESLGQAPTQAPTIMASAARMESGSPLDDMLTAPRPNPHRVTADLLSEVLAGDDLPRFEVMLAHLCKLRAPLLRRLLRDGGSESFAILGRAAGLDAGQFETQWQDWRRQMSELDRLIGPPDRRDARRIGAFFAALTDKQVDRLIQRWRSDGARLFSETAG